MPTFVHLASAKNVSRIRRAGIRRGNRGVFCMPVLPNYYISHQWARELKRSGQRTMVAVNFWLAEDEPVWIGRYDKPHQQTTASEAAKAVMEAPDAEGYEIIVPRSIEKGELRKVRAVPQVVGWRYMPKAHEHKACLCPWCSRGDIKLQRVKQYYARRERTSLSE